MVFSRFALTSSLYPDWRGEGGDVVLQSTCTGGGKGGDGVLKVCSDSVPLIPGLEGGTGVPNVGSDPFPLPGYKGKGGGGRWRPAIYLYWRGEGGDGVLKVCSDIVPLIPGLEGGNGVPSMLALILSLYLDTRGGGGGNGVLQSTCTGGGREAMASSSSALISSSV